MKVIRMSERELMGLVPTWGSYAEKWGDNPEDLILRLELLEDGTIMVKDDTVPAYRTTLEEILPGSEGYEDLLRLFSLYGEEE